MKRNILLALAAVAALALGLEAQDISFDKLYGGEVDLSADPAAVSAPVAAAPVPAAAIVPAKPEWLVMVFISAVNDLGVRGYADSDINEMEKVGSTGEMAVLVKAGVIRIDDDRLDFDGGSKTYLIQRDASTSSISSQALRSADESDMGSPRALGNFILYGAAKYPAKKIAVVLWNHGGGRLGIAWDDLSRRHMEVDALGRALADVRKKLGRKIDLFATDACLMQTAEVVYELRDSVGVIVGSEGNIPVSGYPYDVMLGRLAAEPRMDAEKFGQVIVDAFSESYEGDESSTLSALRTRNIPKFRQLLDEWVSAVYADEHTFARARYWAGSDDEGFSRVYGFPHWDDWGQPAPAEKLKQLDLSEFVDKVTLDAPENSPAKLAGRKLMSFISEDLLVRKTELAGGLAIYLPSHNHAVYEKERIFDRFALARDSKWDDFVRALLAWP